MNLIDSPIPFKSLKIRFESSTMPLTRVALHAKNPLFAERRTLAIEELEYALESWRQTLALA
jgi:hypothetical protein